MTSVTAPPAGVVATRPAPRLKTRTMLVYGAGGIAEAVKSIIFGLFTLYFYTTVMGLSGTLVGIASAFGLVWDAAIDPYIGYLSDRARFRFGRRHTFMLAGALTMGVSFWAFLSPPRGLSTGALFFWMLMTSLMVRTAASVYTIPYLALGAELSQEYHERTRITGLRGILALLGTLVAASLSFVVFFPDSTPGVDARLNYAGYPTMGLAFGMLMTAVGLIAALGTLSWRPYLLQPQKPGFAASLSDSVLPPESGGRGGRTDKPGFSGEGAEFLTSFRQSLSNSSFRVLFASFSLFFLGVVTNFALSIHYLTYYVEINSSADLSTFQLGFYVGGLAGVVFWLRISRVVEKHWLYLLATLFSALVMLAALLLVGEGRLFGTGNVRALAIGHALAGFFASILWFMPDSMIADVADEDELVTGQRREGSFFGIFFFGRQVATGVSLLLAGVLVDRFAGLVPGQAAQTSETVWRIGLLYSALPAALLAVAAGLILRYNLSQRRVAAIRARLDGRRKGALH